MGKETLEKTAERYAHKIWDFSNSNEKLLHSNCKKSFEKGAKWQQERLCDSEVIQRIRATKSDAEARRIIRTI